jgi:hypothetical protein
MQKHFPAIAVAFMAASLIALIITGSAIHCAAFAASVGLLGFLSYLENSRHSEIADLKKHTETQLQEMREKVDQITLQVAQSGF